MTSSDGLPLPRRYWAIAVVIPGITMAVLDGSIVNLALPGITRDLHADASVFSGLRLKSTRPTT